MVMTEDEKIELISKYLTSDNVKELENGTFLFTRQTSLNIAKDFNIFLEDGGVFLVDETVKRMIEIEDKKRAAKISIDTKKKKELDSREKIIDIIRRFDSKDIYPMAKAIVDELPELDENQRKIGINQAKSEGLIKSSSELEIAIKIMINNKALLKRILDIVEKTKDEKELVDKIVHMLLTFFNAGAVHYGNILDILDKTGLSTDIRDICIDKLYNGIQDDFLKRYENPKLSTLKVAEDISKRYDYLGYGFVSDGLSKLNNPNLNIANLTYYLYYNEDAKFVRRVLLTPGLNTREIVNELIDLEIEYPAWCIKKTLDELKKAKLVIPYDDIFDLYMDYIIDKKKEGKAVFELETRDGKKETIEIDLDRLKSASKTGKKEERTQVNPFISEQEELGLATISKRDVLPLEEEEEISKKGKYKILERKKEVASLEKKKTVVAVIAAAGALATTLLASVYNTDVMTAATNSFSAMEPLLSKISGIAQSIPTKDQFISIMASVGTTILATISYFRFKRKESKISTKDKDDNETIVIGPENVEILVQEESGELDFEDNSKVTRRLK